MVSAALLVFGLSVLACGTVLAQRFTSSPQDAQVMEGSNITLQCQVADLDGLNVIWIHEGTMLSVNHLVMQKTSRYFIRDSYNLVLTNVTAADEGSYTCQVSSLPAAKEQLSSLTITVPAEIVQFPEEAEVETTLGESVSFTCGATGKPAPNVVWTFQADNELTEAVTVAPDEATPGLETTDTPTSATATTTASRVTVDSIRAQDGGVYTCAVFNGVGTPDVSYVHLKVLYPPTIYNLTSVVYTAPGLETYLPCKVSAQPQPQVTWYHNGSRLGLRDSPQNKEISVNHEMMTGLEGGIVASDYRLRIREVEEGDLGKYVCHVSNTKGEARMGLTLTALPSKPELMSDVKGDYADVYTLKWSVISFLTPVVYNVMFRKADNASDDDWREVDVLPSPEDKGQGQGSEFHEVGVDIFDLSHSTAYEVIVRAHNSYGWSEESDQFVFTTNAAGLIGPTPTVATPTMKEDNSVTPGPGDSSSAVSNRNCPFYVILLHGMFSTAILVTSSLV